MSHPTRAREILIAVAVLAALPLAGCLFKKQTQPPPASNPTDANDAKLVERMEKARMRALDAPGGAREAADFATQVALLFDQGVPKRRPLPPNLVDEAVERLDKAKQANPQEAADLLVRKGELLLAADKQAVAVAALQESIEVRPNLRAFTLLVRTYTAQKHTAEVEALCKKTLPGMKSDDSRYAVLDECLKSSGAAKPEVGLRWAGNKEISFYKTRRKELEAHAAAARQKK